MGGLISPLSFWLSGASRTAEFLEYLEYSDNFATKMAFFRKNDQNPVIFR